MKPKNHHRGSVALSVPILLVLLLASSCQPSRETKFPNILVIICDQLNADALSCYGGPVPTPHIDKLAGEGLMFRNAICPLPVCSPSRASLVLGEYPHEHGIIHNCMLHDYPAVADSQPVTQQGINNEDLTIDRILNENGYQTYQFGKWHLTGEKLDYMKIGFREHYEYAGEMAPVFNQVQKLPPEKWMDWYGWILPVKQAPEYLDVVRHTSDEFRSYQYADFILKIGELELPREENFDVRVADMTIRAIDEMNNAPFMLTCSFNSPHDPNVAPEPYYSMFDPDSLHLPANYTSIDPYFTRSWSARVVDEIGEAGVKEFLRNYYASVKMVDDQVGRVIRALESKDKLQNTIIIFTADHGDMMGSHRMIWKSNNSFYEEVVRIPLIIHYPALLKPGQPQFPVSTVDLPVTLLGFSGLTVPAQMSGNDLSQFMTGEKSEDEAPKYVLCERLNPHPGHLRDVEPGRPGHFMVRGEGWKYAIYQDGKEFLYDLHNDPEERANLSDHPECRDRKSGMKDELIRLLKKSNYKFKTDSGLIFLR